jgi:hypothetical protein
LLRRSNGATVIDRAFSAPAGLVAFGAMHERPDPAPRRPTGALLFMLVISAVVISVAVLVAVWMYWLNGLLPG